MPENALPPRRDPRTPEELKLVELEDQLDRREFEDELRWRRFEKGGLPSWVLEVREAGRR